MARIIGMERSESEADRVIRSRQYGHQQNPQTPPPGPVATRTAIIEGRFEVVEPASLLSLSQNFTQHPIRPHHKLLPAASSLRVVSRWPASIARFVALQLHVSCWLLRSRWE
mmetsp:Transcript_62359/g.136288  ORF Transcript_62359/g.136288 Transcript_62359/m.136288 type:complete len:112 (+) Transcript_62359:319-654(+)